MATKTFYLKNAVPSGATLHRSLQDGGTAPSAATTTTGWNFGQNNAGQMCAQNGGTEVARGGNALVSWTTSAIPDGSGPSLTAGDCWRTELAYSGTFAAGVWTFAYGCRSVNAAFTGRFRLRFLMWKSTNANGSGATQLPAGSIVSPVTTADLSQTVDTARSVTWTPGSSISLANEYLFFQVAAEITVAGSGNTQDMDFRVGPSYTLTTPDFSPTLVGLLLTTYAQSPLGTGATLQGSEVAMQLEPFLPAPARAYLSWANIVLTPTGEPSVGLTGAEIATAVEDLTGLGGATRAYIGWVSLGLEASDTPTLFVPAVTTAVGTLGSFTGDSLELTGAEIATATEPLYAAQGPTLIGRAIVSRTGLLRESEDNFLLAGIVTPLVSITPFLPAVSMQAGLLGVIGDTDTVVPLQGAQTLIGTAVGLLRSGTIRQLPVLPAIASAYGSLAGPSQYVQGLEGFDITSDVGDIEGLNPIMQLEMAAGTGLMGTDISVGLEGLAMTTTLEEILPPWANLPLSSDIWSPVTPDTSSWANR